MKYTKWCRTVTLRPTAVQVLHHLDDTLVPGDAPYRALAQVVFVGGAGRGGGEPLSLTPVSFITFIWRIPIEGQNCPDNIHTYCILRMASWNDSAAAVEGARGDRTRDAPRWCALVRHMIVIIAVRFRRRC
jgi:hypothetical protein